DRGDHRFHRSFRRTGANHGILGTVISMEMITESSLRYLFTGLDTDTGRKCIVQLKNQALCRQRGGHFQQGRLRSACDSGAECRRKGDTFPWIKTVREGDGQPRASDSALKCAEYIEVSEPAHCLGLLKGKEVFRHGVETGEGLGIRD